MAAGNGNKSRSTAANVAAVGIVAATIAAATMAATMAAKEHKGYENIRRQWRPNGPVERFDPLDDSPIPTVPAERPQSEADATESAPSEST